MDDNPTPLVTPVPSILAVGCTKVLVEAASLLAIPNGLVLRSTSLDALRADTLRYRPLVLLVGADVYDFDPEGIDEVARDVSAHLAVVGTVREVEVLLERIISYVRSRAVR